MLLRRTNIEEKLVRSKSEAYTSDEILEEVQRILKKDSDSRERIAKNINGGHNTVINSFDFELLETGKIYHIDQIQKICIDYRLRFLNSKYFKGEIPQEAISKIKRLEQEHDIEIKEHTKVENIIPQQDGTFKITTTPGEEYLSNNVLIAIGRRGSPRKLNIPGEESQKVAYRLLEPERITNKEVIVVGAGDSAIEAAMMLMVNNDVRQLVRTETLTRCKPKNRELVTSANAENKLNMMFNSNLVAINDRDCLIKTGDQTIQVPNDLVYILAGGELPTQFLEKIGVRITKKFGETVLKHN